MVRAVVIVGPNGSGSGSGELSSAKLVENRSLACVEMLGRTVLGRTIEELLRGRIDSVVVIGTGPFTSAVMGHEKVDFFSAQDPWSKAAQKAASFDGDAVLLMRLGAYVEFDPADMLQFYRDQDRQLTRACNHEGCLDLWVINPSNVPRNDSLFAFLESENITPYFIPGYVNRLESPRDMRQLISDGLAGRCHFRPQGLEIKPGIWIGHGAQVERTARLVAPTFIGANSKISDQCLITRASSVESNSHIDYGTVIEDTTVLSNTYVGIGLDLSHSIVEGGHLLNLQHGVMLRMSDPVVLRRIKNSKVHSTIDGSFLANLDVRNMALSSVPKKEQ